MQGFTNLFVVPLIKSRKWSRLCEIGACQGAGTEMLRKLPYLSVTVIDPCLDCDLRQKFAAAERIETRKGLSLQVLPTLDLPFNCILIDGDHNWYTVYNELKLIDERNLLRPGGVIFFHDVAWPWARRDMYYQPETIPPEYRHKCEEVIDPEKSGPLGGIEFRKACFEGGARNGVLTAIEDFLREERTSYRFFRVTAGHGLGILQRRGGLRDGISFISLSLKGSACNLASGIMKLMGWNMPLAITQRFLRAAKERSSTV